MDEIGVRVNVPLEMGRYKAVHNGKSKSKFALASFPTPSLSTVPNSTSTVPNNTFAPSTVDGLPQFGFMC